MKIRLQVVWMLVGLLVDAYPSQIDGQFVEITGLPDGVYALQSIVDPGNIILEVDEMNNGAVVYFRLEGKRWRCWGMCVIRRSRG